MSVLIFFSTVVLVVCYLQILFKNGCKWKFLFNFIAALRKQHAAELHLGDFLVFLRRVVSSKAIQSKMASPKWTEVLLNIASQKCCSGKSFSKCDNGYTCSSWNQVLFDHILHTDFNSSTSVDVRMSYLGKLCI